ncbi:nucleotide exchange factor GrpE [Streptomyces alkaliterrae]|uniref:Protein GrpE n=1 Tax=Streptomyces alkaliterrae TaxID=2213162 RepID=A0A5P0YS42_9ACTN|nr:nucleotide exchange factor GrpE [Streptomyces alkaliterrae]MBB1261896.1 nucleotide exchange factor GrpE [Streptomyces alkaliterrae]MQS03136.1 nucleotide exchange factor GrpE [Streptomyces alkaliterrae]
MTEETPGFDKNEPEVPADDAARSDDTARGAGAAEQAGPGAPAAESAGVPAGGEAGPGSGAGQEVQQVALTAQLDQARTALRERTEDLQRLQAEFANYRRRVERDRVTVKEVAVANLLTELLPVLDDIGRARDHGELVGGFKVVAESLETVVAKMGLQQFGKEGEPFDPTVHEALMHSYSPEVSETTCVQILQPGYRIGERTIRPARVGVAEPQPGGPARSEDAADAGKDAKEAGEAKGSDDGENGGPEEG